MKDWVCAPNWLIMTAERRASNGLKATYPKTEGLQAVQKPKMEYNFQVEFSAECLEQTSVDKLASIALSM